MPTPCSMGFISPPLGCPGVTGFWLLKREKRSRSEDGLGWLYWGFGLGF